MENPLWGNSKWTSEFLAMTIACLAAVCVAVPFLLAVDNSLKNEIDLFRPGAIIPFLQFTPTLHVWKRVIYDPELLNCFFSSALVGLSNGNRMGSSLNGRKVVGGNEDVHIGTHLVNNTTRDRAENPEDLMTTVVMFVQVNDQESILKRALITGANMFQPVEIHAGMDVDVSRALNAYRPPGKPTLDLEPGINRGFEVKHENGLTSRHGQT